MNGKKWTFALALAVAAIVSASAYAFTASNTVPASQSGIGSEAISGYAVSDVSYTLNATDPSLVDSVAFTITPAATTTVKAQLASGGAWYDCLNSAGSVSCDTTAPAATVADASQLSVVAAQ